MYYMYTYVFQKTWNCTREAVKQLSLQYPWSHHMARLGLIYIAENLLRTHAICSASCLGDHHLVQMFLSHCWPHCLGVVAVINLSFIS